MLDFERTFKIKVRPKTTLFRKATGVFQNAPKFLSIESPITK